MLMLASGGEEDAGAMGLVAFIWSPTEAPRKGGGFHQQTIMAFRQQPNNFTKQCIMGDWSYE